MTFLKMLLAVILSGGTMSVKAQSATFDLVGTELNVGDEKGATKAPTKAAKAWVYVASTNKEMGSICLGDWTPPVAFTVSFDANGHGEAPEAVVLRKGETVPEPAAPAEDGYTFTGWFRDKEATAAWNFSKDTVTDHLILYAGWTERVTPRLGNPAVTYSPVYVRGVHVSSANAADVLGNGTVSWDNATSTLTLNNADLTVTKEQYNAGVGVSTGPGVLGGCIVNFDAGDYSKPTITIRLVGTNKITSTGISNWAGGINSNVLNRELAITGEGSLEIDSYATNIFLPSITGQAKSLIIDGATVKLNRTDNSSQPGIHADRITMKNGARVEIKGDRQSIECDALTVSDSDVNIEKSGYGSAIAIWCTGENVSDKLTIKGSSNVTITSGASSSEAVMSCRAWRFWTAQS